MLFALGRFNRAGKRTRGGGGGESCEGGKASWGWAAERGRRDRKVHEISHATCVRVCTAVVACVRAPQNVGERKQTVAHIIYF